ncbi:MAG: LLM class flavin-dependent oxidoreductase [Pseudonocardia sp.]|uniref:LLM class flavin-dependent oxidoreductase n=1 Tax=unclassified Pseudonocardia TaxID=2619320 RepID=UPI00086BECF3|nr:MULTISPECIES: LLM class flavin-dependent oxidoreductase [unclassified Pseudonocardia]MBN9112433.1 LLM class flavin-dependent oxidoreductase [Pseudonocardia sp.]ODU27295.1 MAG: hypothetical protein ABS80_03920 [Pseudonocardia sp. SCN 72-51]ODV08908.1 MAG: hypothetical protein ABT15_01310 [Pseudonocardia sp. SCN 73-27]
MQTGITFGLQLPRPWGPGSERRLFAEALDQVELADRLGFDHAWTVEQHFLEEYSHSSAPELFLAAASQRTSTIRLGHGVVLTPPGYNHPARVAERIATLDLVSGGRVDFGFGDSKSRVELEGFGVDAGARRAMSLEAVEQIADMMALEPYPGHRGEHFAMPARNVVPKPVQKPHPPLWIACSDDATVQLAARLGVGALAHSFFDAAEAAHVVAGYYETFRRECVPIGHVVNPAVAMVDPFYCHEDGATATAVGMRAHGFRTYAARHYYSFGRHRPGYTDLAANAEVVRAELGGDVPLRGGHAIGTPGEIAQHLRGLEAAGVDQVILTHQAGGLTHQQVCESLELFAREVRPALLPGEQERLRRREAELAPHIAAALERKARRQAPGRDAVPLCDAYGLSRETDVELVGLADMSESTRAAILELNRLKAIALRLEP